MSSKRKRDDSEPNLSESVLKDEVEFARMDSEFPRGGGSVLAPLDIRKATIDATNDVFDKHVKSKKQKKTKSNAKETQVKLSTQIEPFSLNKITVGTLVLGEVIELKSITNELIVSLPNQLVGYCKVDEISNSVVNRFLRFYVVEIGMHPKRRIELSYDPELVNQTITQEVLVNGLAVQGIVKSVEEKGLYVDLGSQLQTGFISLKTVKNYFVGEPILAFVNKPESRVKGLTLNADFAAQTVIEQSSLVPGTLIKSCPIDRETVMGNVYDLLGHLKATSDAVHSYSNLNKVRVLFSYPATQLNGNRRLGVSKLQHVVDLETKSNTDLLGKIFECEVKSVLPNLGLFVQFGKITGFVHVSQVSSSEEKVDLEDDEFKVGSKHVARVVNTCLIDGLAYLSFNKEVIDQRYMSLTEVKIGDVVRNAKIDRILPKGGVLVRLSTSVVGIAQDMQLVDSAMKNPETKFKKDQKVAARVLDVDFEKQRVVVSLKKSIVDFEGQILQSFDFPFRNEETVGTVISFIDAGALVVFFNNVRGLLPNSEMSESGAKASKVLRLGQTVRVSVVDANSKLRRLILSTRPPTQLSTNQVGSVFSAKVISKNKQEVRVSIFDNGKEVGEAIVVGKSKNLNVGDELNAKVLTDRLVSVDEKVVNGNVPKSIDEIEVGNIVIGIVRSHNDNVGLFVDFCGGLSGLIPANLLGSDSSKWPSTNSVVEVQVDSIDVDKQRVFLSLATQNKKTLRTVSVTIQQVKETQLNVVTTDGEQGRINCSQLFDNISEIKDVKNPLAQFKKNQVLENVKVIGRHDARNHRFLPLTHQQGTSMLELSIVDVKPIVKNSRMLAFINNYSPDGQSLYLTLSPTCTAQLSLVDLSNDADVLSNPEIHFPVGSAINVKVLSTGSNATCTALESTSDIALISQVEPLWMMVRLPNHKTAKVDCVLSGDEFTELKKTFDVGDLVNFYTLNGKVSLRETPFEPVEKGQVCQGFVVNIADGGVFVKLNDSQKGRVKIGEISDQYLKNWKSAVHIGQVVNAKVLSVSNEGKIELSLKPSTVTGRKQANVEHVEVGTTHTGHIVRIETFGVFVEFDGVRGLCHHSEISDHKIDDLNRVFKVGDSVKVKVLSKDSDSGKLSLGMKAEYFDDESESDMDVEEEVEEEGEGKSDSFAFNSDDEDEESEGEDDNEDSDSEDEDSDSEDDSESTALSAKFNWSGELPTNTEDHSSDSDSDSDSDAPRTRRRKKKEEFVTDETAVLQTRAPESAREFERLLVATPSSSILWTQYMAYQLKLGEIDATREVARRALKEIPQKEELERMNIWLALLNVEVQFGSKDSTEKVFKEAQQFMDTLQMHLKMAQIYAEAGKLSEAKTTYSAAQKRFGSTNLDVWVNAMRFLFTTGEDPEAARALADKAQQRLPNRLVKDFVRQFALMEFEVGNAERGRTLFEALLSTNAKRVDLWNVYIDQEIKLKDEAKFTALFDRALQQRISMKQAKFFFKKWIMVASDQEYVKERAKEYVTERERTKDEDEETEE